MNQFYTETHIISLFLELFFVNIAFLIISVILIKKARRISLEFNWSMQVIFSRLRPGVFVENCKRYGLTKSEMMVVSLLCHGLSNREIASRIFIAEDTVKTHVKHIFLKANVKSRMELSQVLRAGTR